MSSELALVLQITAVGMGLVFGAILLFWALMAALVRIAPEPAPAAAVVPEPAPAAAPEPAAERALKQRAAAAAVAVALAQTTRGPVAPAAPATAQVSAWQAVMRANQLSQRGPVR